MKRQNPYVLYKHVLFVYSRAWGVDRHNGLSMGHTGGGV